MIDTLIYLSINQQNILLIIRLEIALSNHKIDVQHLLSCYKEEEDDRISLHDIDQL